MFHHQPLAPMLWRARAKPARSIAEARAALNHIGEVTNTIADETVQRYYQQDS